MKPITLARLIITTAMAGILILPVSCYRKFYKVSNESSSATIENTIVQKNKYFIMRAGNNAFHMANIVPAEDHKSITCTLDSLPEEHLLYLIAGRKNGIPYKKSKGEEVVLNEVHIYTPQNNTLRYGTDYTLDISSILKIEILEKDRNRTTISTVWSTGAIALSLTGLIATIAGSGSSNDPPSQPSSSGSCPFVSAYDGEEFLTQGELFAGAVYPQLARNDYLSLNMMPASPGRLQLKISNEQQEIQNTDLAELMVITHPKRVQIIADENGKLFSIAKPESPVAATFNGKDILNTISKSNDDHVYAYSDTGNTLSNNAIQLAFTKNNNNSQAKLILQLRNTVWMEYVFNKVMQGYGTYYPAFIKQQHNKPAEELKSWISKQQIPLTISILTNDGWKSITSINSVGPLSMRQILVPIDLSNVAGNTVQIKLESGFMFWETDYAAIDFSKDENYTVEKLLPANAMDENGKDVTAVLSAADEKYLVQPVPGNITTIIYTYNTIPDQDKTQTYILHAKGYYEYVRDFKNKPDISFLQQFKNPGALSNYSMALYKQFANGDMSKMAKQ